MSDDVPREAPADRKLTAVDRCDQCGAQAYVLIWMTHGELLWCVHHWNRNREKATATAVVWYDHSDELTAAVE